MKSADDPSFDATLDAPAAAAPEAPSAAASLASGRLIGGRYEIVRPLGAGAMGAVYEARNRAIERRVALKVLHPGFSHDPSTLQRFGAEARAAGRARHRNIVEVIDFGADGPMHWMALEFLEGETLEELVTREAPMAPSEVVSILDPLLRGVAHAHTLGLIHRDLKPGNLFLAREPGTEGVVPKVLDFGIAKNTTAAVRLTTTETLVGTPAYMAPEQIESSRDVTPAADQYAMACVAYEMLTGQLPIGGDSLPGLLVNKVTRAATPLDSARPDLSPALAACVMRALSRDPAARFPDVDAFRVELLASIAAPSAPPPIASPSPATAAAPRAASRVGASARVVATAALVTLAALAAATVVSQRRRASATPPPATQLHTHLSPPLRDAALPSEDRPARLEQTPPETAHDAPDAGPVRVEDARPPRHHTRRPSERDPQGHRLSIDPVNPL